MFSDLESELELSVFRSRIRIKIQCFQIYNQN